MLKIIFDSIPVTLIVFTAAYAFLSINNWVDVVLKDNKERRCMDQAVINLSKEIIENQKLLMEVIKKNSIVISSKE